jgi:hypothetical protein
MLEEADKAKLATHKSLKQPPNGIIGVVFTGQQTTASTWPGQTIRAAAESRRTVIQGLAVRITWPCLL